MYVENQMSRKMEMMSLEQNQCNQKEEGGLIMEVDNNNNNKDEDVIGIGFILTSKRIKKVDIHFLKGILTT